MHIGDFTVQVRPVAVATVATAHNIVTATEDVDWPAGLHRYNPGDLPATERGLQQAARTVAQHWDAVDEVSGKIVGPVERTRPQIVPPADIGIGNRIQLLTAATGGGVDGA